MSSLSSYLSTHLGYSEPSIVDYIGLLLTSGLSVEDLESELRVFFQDKTSQCTQDLLGLMASGLLPSQNQSPLVQDKEQGKEQSQELQTGVELRTKQETIDVIGVRGMENALTGTEVGGLGKKEGSVKSVIEPKLKHEGQRKQESKKEGKEKLEQKKEEKIKTVEKPKERLQFSTKKKIEAKETSVCFKIITG